MKINFVEEEKELFNTYLDTYIFPPVDPTKDKIVIGRPVELIIKPQCNQKCEYCYIYKHGDDLYPLAERISDEEILKNMDSVLDYILNTRKVFIKDWELFAGDVYGNGLIYKILDVFYKYYKEQYEKHRFWYRDDFVQIMMPCNFYYLAKRPEDVQKTIDYQAKLEEIGVHFSLSCSTDGKYATDIREKEDLDDAHFDSLMKAGLALRAGFHPMVSYESIDHAIENYDWWLEQFDKYFPDGPMKPFSPMFLEVRNDGWTDESIAKYVELLQHVIDRRIEACGSIKEFARTLFAGRSKDEPLGQFMQCYDLIALNPVSTESNERVSCGMQSNFMINLQNMSVVPCHRLAYAQFIGAKFVQDEQGKIVDIEPKNVSNYLNTEFFKTQALPRCQICDYKEFCLKGCYGSQFESRGDMYIPIRSVCKLFKAKYEFLVKTYMDMGIIQAALDNGYLKNNEQKEAIIRLANRLGYEI